MNHAEPSNTAFNPCVVVPVYNHEHAIARVVEGLCRLSFPIILIDDGSRESCARELNRLASNPQIELQRHKLNQGKGSAVVTGLRAAHARGFTHALQIDADEQHSLADVPRFIDEARMHPDGLVCGQPIFDDSIPASRLYGRYFSHVMVWLETLSLAIPDSMCGMRLYPLQPMMPLLDSTRGKRMDFDIEILVRSYWRNIPIRWLLTRVSYPADGVSHYRLIYDNLFVVGLHTRLTFGMLWRIPMLIRRNLARPHSTRRVIQ